MVALPKYLLSCEELARWLGIQPCTIRKWTCYNKIPYIKIGRRVGYKREHIEAWIEATNPQLEKWEKILRRRG